MGKRILALATEPVSGEALKSAMPPGEAEEAEVLVVAPALTSRTRFWLSDTDDAIRRADEVQQESVERMDEGGGDGAGDTAGRRRRRHRRVRPAAGASGRAPRLPGRRDRAAHPLRRRAQLGGGGRRRAGG